MTLFKVSRQSTILETNCPLDHLGFGVFETMRLRLSKDNSPFIVHFNEHCRRFKHGCAQLGLAQYDETFLWQRVLDLPKAEGKHIHYRLRFICNPLGLFFSIDPYSEPDATQGLRLLPYQAERPFPELKSCSAIVSQQSHASAIAAGFDTALLYDRNQQFSECSWANFFWFDTNGTLCTQQNSVLPGITKRIIEQLYPVQHRPLALDGIAEHCVEGFVTQATSGVQLVAAIGDVNLESVKENSLSNALKRSFFNTVLR